jgi:hypothetical protein
MVVLKEALFLRTAGWQTSGTDIEVFECVLEKEMMEGWLVLIDREEFALKCWVGVYLCWFWRSFREFGKLTERNPWM